MRCKPLARASQPQSDALHPLFARASPRSSARRARCAASARCPEQKLSSLCHCEGIAIPGRGLTPHSPRRTGPRDHPLIGCRGSGPDAGLARTISPPPRGLHLWWRRRHFALYAFRADLSHQTPSPQRSGTSTGHPDNRPADHQRIDHINRAEEARLSRRAALAQLCRARQWFQHARCAPWPLRRARAMLAP
jgi:hypothetical protein